MSRALFSILLTVFFLAFGMSFVAPLIPLMLKSIGASSATIGQIQTTYFLSFTIATSLLGRWIDRIGSKKIIIVGLFIFGLAIFLMPFMPTPTFFYLIRIVQGVGSALLFAPTEAAINIISPPEKRASNMGLYGLVFAAGFAIGPVIGTSLYSVNTAAPFIFGALSCFVAITVLTFGFKETKIPVKKTEWGFYQLISFIKIPLTAAACYAFIEVSIASFLSLYLDVIGIGGAALGIVFTFFAVGGAVSPLPAGKIADRMGKRPVLKACGFLLVAVTFAFNFSQNYWVICLLTFFVGVIAGALYPVSLSLIGELVPPEKMGTANASFSFFYGLGSIAGPLITGWVLEISSIKYLFYPMTVSALLFVIIMALHTTKTDSSPGYK
jgi:MFS family permease